MRCLNCGTENPDGNRFCVNCGTPLAEPDSGPYTPPEPAGYGAPEPEAYAPPVPGGYTPPEPAGYAAAEPESYTPPEPDGYAAPDPAPYEGPGDLPPDAPEDSDAGFRPMPPSGQDSGGGKLGRGGKGGRRGKKSRAGGSTSGPSYGTAPNYGAAPSYGTAGRPQQPVRRSGGSRLPLLIVLGVLALALLGGGLYFLLGRGNRTRGGDTPPPIAIQTASPGGDAAETAPVETPAAETPAAQTQQPVPAAGEKLTPAQVEDAVTDIRSRYNDIMSAVSAGTYTSRTTDDVTVYFDGDDVKCIVVPGGTNGSTYSRWFYFDHGQLFFAYYEGKDAHRLYFKDDVMLRWRYCTDKDQPDNAENYDQLDTDAYRAKQDQVLEDARRFHP